jgi:hypothetical protein
MLKIKLSSVFAALAIIGISYTAQVVAADVTDYRNGEANTSITSRYGTLAIQKTNDGDQLLFNKKAVAWGKEGDSYALMIMAKAELESQDIFIVWGGSGGTMDADSNIHCKFLTISSATKYSVSGLTYCPLDQAKIVGETLQYNFANPLPYADRDDRGLLSFDSNKIILLQRVKRESYYRQKYAKSTPKQVYDLFASDYQSQQESPTVALQRIIQNKMWSHIDGMYGTRYCQPFLWLKNPPHDQYYNLLAPACAKDVYGS